MDGLRFFFSGPQRPPRKLKRSHNKVVRQLYIAYGRHTSSVENAVELPGRKRWSRHLCREERWWIELEGNHSISLTDEGCRLMAKHAH